MQANSDAIRNLLLFIHIDLPLKRDWVAQWRRFPICVWALLSAMLLVGLCCTASNAVPVFQISDIGSTGATGTYSYSAGTYTVAGAGTGIGGTSDSFSYASLQTSGNIELVAKVASQTNTSNYAVAGLMMRDSLNANGASAVIGVSPANGVNFTYRATAGGPSTTMLGPSIAVPVYLRIVRSQSSIAGYQSNDGISWQLVGEYQIPMPSKFYVGLAVSSNSFGNLSTATFNSLAYMTSVPQRSANLISWLRADVGVISSSGNVSQWTDQSGNGNNATQGTSANQPTLVTGAINSLPALAFNGTSQYLQLPSGYANFTSGASIFIVAKPTTFSTYGHMLFLATNTAGNDGLIFQEGSTSGSMALNVLNGSSASQVIASSGITLNTAQLLEAIDSGGGSPTGTLYTNGVQEAQGAVNTLNNVTRTTNTIGNTTYYFTGQIAEILVYNTALTAVQRASVESYIFSKYGIGNVPTLDAPIISPGNSVFSAAPQTVTITSDIGANIYYTTDGSTPMTSSTPYTGPFTISSSTTVKAICALPYFTTSSVSSAYLQYDPATANVSRSGLLAWYKADNSVSTSGSSVTQWADVSGNSYNATQSNSSFQPTFVGSAINSLPAISFNGSNQFLQIPSGFANFTSGASIFVVAKPTALSTFAHILYFATDGVGTDGLISQEGSASGSMALTVLNGSSSSQVTASSAVTVNTAQLLEAIDSGGGSPSGTLYTNGAQKAQGSVNTLNNVTRTTNYIGGQTYYFTGQIAEILVYNTALSATQRANVENYLFARYGLAVNAPTLSVASGVYASAQSVTITADPGAQIYYTTDGSTPTSSSNLYTGPITISSITTLKAIALQTFGTSAVSTAYIAVDVNSAPISRSGLLNWFRSDCGVITSGSNISQWTDLSGNGNNATQSVSNNQPTLLSNIVNGLPTLNFNPTVHPQFLILPPGYANFTSGFYFFIVANPTAIYQAGGRFLDLGVGSGSGTNSLGMTTASSTTSGLFTYNGSTGSSITGSMTLNNYQLLEGTQNGAGTGTTYTNGILGTQSSLQNLVNISRGSNYIGQFSGGGSFYYQGQIAEMLIYNTALTATQRAATEAYLMQKYQPFIQVPPAPILSVVTSTLSGPTSVAISARNGTAIFYTTDGTTPTTSSNLYTGPINVLYTQTVKAIAATNGFSSAVSSANYTLDSTQWLAPNGGDPTTLQINLQMPTGAIP